MSRRKREAAARAAEVQQAASSASVWKKFTGARQIGIAGVVLVLVLGVLGAISENYKKSVGSHTDASLLAPVKQPVQTGTPQLSKEYIYAGSRMLAVQDINGQSNVTNSISGKFFYGVTKSGQASRPVSQIYMNLSGESEPRTFMTGSTDTYQFGGLIPGTNYTVTPYKGGEVNGITAFDATLVLRHVAAGGQGPNALNANQKLAADADNSGDVSSFDATQILRFVAAAGWTSGTGQVGYWKFADAPRSYPSFSGTFSGENFDSILVGEVDGDWDPTAPSLIPTTYNIQIYPNSSTGAQNSTVTIPVFFSSNSTQPVSSYSFQFKFDPLVLQPNSTVINASGTLSANCLTSSSIGNGVVGVSASCGSNTISANSGTPTLIYLNFTVIGEPEAYTSLWFNYAATGNRTPMFQDSQGNEIMTYPYGGGSFTVEAPPPEAAASDSFSNKKSENPSATFNGSARDSNSPAEQQQEQPGTEQMQISLPANAVTMQGGTLIVPVTLTNSNGNELSAFSFDVQFNPALLQPAGAAIDIGGTLASTCKVVEHADSPGRIGIAGACANDINAISGTLLKLRFTVKGQAANASQQARALKLQQTPRFVNHHGKQIGVGRIDGSIR